MQTEVQVVSGSKSRRLEGLFAEEVEKARGQALKYTELAKLAIEKVAREADKGIETVARNVELKCDQTDQRVESLKSVILEMHQYHHRSILMITEDYQMTAQRTDYLLTRCEMDRTEMGRLFGRLVDTEPVESHLFEEGLIQEGFVRTRKLIHSLKSNITQMNGVLNETQRAISAETDQQESEHRNQIEELNKAHEKSIQDLKDRLADTEHVKDRLLLELEAKTDLKSEFDKVLLDRDYTIKKNMGKINELENLLQEALEDNQKLWMDAETHERDRQLQEGQMKSMKEIVEERLDEMGSLNQQINGLRQKVEGQRQDLLLEKRRNGEFREKSKEGLERVLEFLKELKVAKEAMQVDIEYLGSKLKSSVALLRVEYSTACKRYKMRVAEEHERTQGLAFGRIEEELKSELRRYRLLNENQARRLREFEEVFEEKESRIQEMLNSHRESVVEEKPGVRDDGRQRAPQRNQPIQNSVSPGLSSLRISARPDDRGLKRDLPFNQTVPLQLSSKGKGGDSVVNHKLKMFEEKYKKELDDILK